MRKTIGVIALALALSGSAYAGDMQNDAPQPPPPSPVQQPTTAEASPSLTDELTELLIILIGTLTAPR